MTALLDCKEDFFLLKTLCAISISKLTWLGSQLVSRFKFTCSLQPDFYSGSMSFLIVVGQTGQALSRRRSSSSFVLIFLLTALLQRSVAPLFGGQSLRVQVLFGSILGSRDVMSYVEFRNVM